MNFTTIKIFNEKLGYQGEADTLYELGVHVLDDGGMRSQLCGEPAPGKTQRKYFRSCAAR